MTKRLELTVSFEVDEDDMVAEALTMSKFSHLYISSKPGNPNARRVRLEALTAEDRSLVFWSET